MRKPHQIYDLPISDDDYKMAIVMERDKANFESRDIWFYLGADCRNSRYAKVGITMGDLSSRSYSSANPNYFLLCAFQCRHGTTKEQLVNIEGHALNYLDSVFIQENGISKRARHFESQRLSECYYDIDFDDFFICLHEYLWEYHYSFFQISEYEYHTTGVYGDALSCEFNPRLTIKQRSHFLRLIVR
ncbi:hypothetical protein VYS60_004311 [Salmonella enterica]|nr:hypothetical protein [Salmonella enterica]